MSLLSLVQLYDILLSVLEVILQYYVCQILYIYIYIYRF